MVRLLVLGTIVSMAGTPASAALPSIGITAVSEDFLVTTAPVSLRNDAFESSNRVRVFLERERYLEEIGVNASVPGTYDAYGDFDDPIIAPMGGVRSYLIHFDQVGDDVLRLGGSVTFKQPILGIIARSRTLEATDDAVGAIGTLYPTVREGRQVEYDRPDDHDFFRLEDDGRTLYAFMQVTTKFDQIRVLTAVPEPSAVSLALAAMLASAATSTRRRTRQVA